MTIISIDPHSAKNQYYTHFNNDFLIDHGNVNIDNLNELIGSGAVVVVEDQYLGKNFKTVTSLSRIVGRIQEICHYRGATCVLINTAVWQAHFKITGKSEDRKQAMIKMASYFGFKAENDDEAASFLIGVYYWHNFKK